MAKVNNLIINENGIEKKAILYDKDHLPAKLIVDGNVLTNVSFNDKLIEGTTEVTYNSEYKKNLLNMSVEGNTEQSLLPTEYQQVEYIESTGTQYIDTGVLASENNSFEVKAQLVHTNTASQTIWGGRNSATNNEIQGNQLSFSKPTQKYQFACGNIAAVTGAFDENLHIYKANKNVLYIDGNLTYTVATSQITTQNNVYLFATNTNGTVGFNGGDLKIYYCKIWNNETLLRNFIPCYRKADNVIGLYDLVNNVFYTNKGTGTFLKGNDTIPPVEQPIPIENSTNVSAELSGVNLFDYKDIQLNYGTRTTDLGDGILVETDSSQKVKVVYFRPFEVEEGTKYCVSLDCAFLNSYPDSVRPNEIFLRASTNTSTSTTNDKLLSVLKLGTSAELSTKKNSCTIPVGYKYLKIQFYLNVIGSDLIENHQATLKNIMVSKDDFQPYQPYFAPTKVDIPLTLRGIGDRKDNLSIDYINKKAIVKRNVFESDLLDLEWSLISSSNNNTYFQADINKSFSSTGGYCNRCKVIQGNATNENLADGEFKVYFNGDIITLVFASNFDLKNDTASKFGDLNKLNQWLTNNPTNIALALLFNDTEEYKEEQWVKDLLALPTQNATNIINISADVPVSSLKITHAEWGGKYD